MKPIDRVFSKAKRFSTELIGSSFFAGLVTRKIKDNYILMYHGVTATGSTQFNRRHVSVSCFKKQLDFLVKNFSVISLADFFEEKFDPTRANFAITFDDGYRNNYVNAKPILEQYQCPATFFISGLNQIGDNILWGDFVNIASYYAQDDITIEGEKFIKKKNIYYSTESGKSLYEVIKHDNAAYTYKLKVREAFGRQVNVTGVTGIEEYWQLMTDPQISDTAASKYVTIGCHGYYHNNLGSIAHADACDELMKGKKYLENLTQHSINQLAFPDGSYTLQLSQSAYESGFNMQVAVDDFLHAPKPHPAYIKTRSGVYAVDSCLNQHFTAIKIQ
jgi:peptidoglycan/xylan/chitin deacetylase (PgdA/CDA1 family)